MPKFFVDENQIIDNKLNIIGDDVNHIKNVLRYKIEDTIEVTIKQKKETLSCRIEEIKKDKIVCNILDKVIDSTEPNTYIHIFQALPKQDKMELIIQKNVEIGVSEITPIFTKRCIVKLDEKSEQSKILRWNKISEVAAKQSNRDIIPKINVTLNIKNIYEKVNNYDIVLVAYENEQSNLLKNELKKLVNKANLKIAIIIGPEGGLEEQEIQNLINNGAKVVSLGKRILRTETAALVMASNILYELD